MFLAANSSYFSPRTAIPAALVPADLPTANKGFPPLVSPAFLFPTFLPVPVLQRLSLVPFPFNHRVSRLKLVFSARRGSYVRINRATRQPFSVLTNSGERTASFVSRETRDASHFSSCQAFFFASCWSCGSCV